MSAGSNYVTHLSDSIGFTHTFMIHVAYGITQALVTF